MLSRFKCYEKSLFLDQAPYHGFKRTRSPRSLNCHMSKVRNNFIFHILRHQCCHSNVEKSRYVYSCQGNMWHSVVRSFPWQIPRDIFDGYLGTLRPTLGKPSKRLVYTMLDHIQLLPERCVYLSH